MIIFEVDTHPNRDSLMTSACKKNMRGVKGELIGRSIR
jgi:hypothetical protein